MLYALKKLWTAFYVAVLLFVVAAFVAGQVAMASPDCLTCGANVALTFWIMAVGAHQPVLWAKAMPFRRRLIIWLTALAIGLVTYVGMEALALSVFASGNVARGLQLGLAANVVGVLAAPVASRVLVHRSSRGRPAASPAAIQPDGASVASPRVNVALRLVAKAVLSVALMLSLVAIISLPLHERHLIEEGRRRAGLTTFDDDALDQAFDRIYGRRGRLSQLYEQMQR